MSRDALAAHLEYLAELGVTGISSDPAWRTRRQDDPQPLAMTSESPTVPVSAQAALAAVAQAAPPVQTQPVAVASPSTSAARPVADAAGDAGTLLPMIRADIGDCTRCKLHTGRNQIVFGVGNPSADLLFVGEAPGADEDMQGVPFVGRAGQLLTKIIEAIGLTRDEVYIANVIKCRPPGNRNPEPDEVEQCEPFLFRQIDAIKPKVIVALGKFAAQSLLRSAEPISKLRGREFPFRDAVLMPTFHPAYLLRNPSAKREVWDDMKRVRELLTAVQTGR